MFDCGIHPAYSGLVSLPYFDEIDPAKIDILLVTISTLIIVVVCHIFSRKLNFLGNVI